MPDEKTEEAQEAVAVDDVEGQDKLTAPEDPYDIAEPDGEDDRLTLVDRVKNFLSPSKDQDGADEAEAEAEQASEEPPVILPASLIQRAEQLGMSREDAQAIGKADVLARTLSLLQPAPAEGAEPNSEAAQEEAPAEGFKVELDVEDYGQEFIAQQEKMAKYFDDRIADLTKAQNELQEKQAAAGEVAAQAAAVEAVASFDALVGGAGDYEKVLGKGTIADLKDSSPELANRESVFDEMQYRKERRESLGQTPLSDKELFDLSLRVVFPEQATNVAKSTLNKTLKKRQGQMTAKPNQRANADDRSAEQKARETVQAKLAELGEFHPTEDLDDEQI